jgi:hypothetical protein
VQDQALPLQHGEQQKLTEKNTDKAVQLRSSDTNYKAVSVLFQCVFAVIRVEAVAFQPTEAIPAISTTPPD